MSMKPISLWTLFWKMASSLLYLACWSSFISSYILRTYLLATKASMQWLGLGSAWCTGRSGGASEILGIAGLAVGAAWRVELWLLPLRFATLGLREPLAPVGGFEPRGAYCLLAYLLLLCVRGFRGLRALALGLGWLGKLRASGRCSGNPTPAAPNLALLLTLMLLLLALAFSSLSFFSSASLLALAATFSTSLSASVACWTFRSNVVEMSLYVGLYLFFSNTIRLSSWKAAWKSYI